GRYSQARQALVSAESELKDAKSRILILEQSENDVKLRVVQELEASYEGQMQTQVDELGNLRSHSQKLEQELRQSQAQLENIENTYFNQIEALKQSYQVQINELEGNALGATVETLEQTHQEQINELHQSYQARIQEIEQAYQIQLLAAESATEREWTGPPVVESLVQEETATNLEDSPAWSHSTAELDAMETFIGHPFMDDESAVTPPELAHLETWVTSLQEEDKDLVGDTDEPREVNYLETWVSPALEEEEEEVESGNVQNLNYLETWISNPVEEQESSLISEPPVPETNYLETWITAPLEDEEEIVPPPDFVFPESFQEEVVAAPDFGFPQSFQEEESSSESWVSEGESGLGFLDSLTTEEDIARISSLEELTTQEGHLFDRDFSNTDNDLLELLPQEENDSAMDDLFSLGENQELDMDLFNSLELDLAESAPQEVVNLGTDETDLEFFNLLNDDNSALESLATDDSNISLDDLFGEDFLSSAWDATPGKGQEEDLESPKR
ncbi:MAG: hypothetical protein RLZZ148_1386, partial [Cyanobacteriota bacterium]